MEPTLLIVAGIIVFVVVAAVSHHLKQRRRQEMAALAAKLGLQYSTDDPFGLDELPFELFSRGDGRGCENVLWGTWQSHDVRLCDYWYYDESTDSEGRTSRTYHRYSCAILAVPFRCAPLSIGAEGFFSRLADHIGFRDIEFESEEFNRTFNVKCDDRKFATDLIDARMMQWLLYAGKGWSYQTSGDLIMCATGKTDPANLQHHLECLKAFVAHVPRVVHDLYPAAGGV